MGGVLRGLSLMGLFRGTARPNEKQRFRYSAYSKSHGMTWMVVTCPGGLIGACFGPYEGKIADATMLQNSGITNRLDRTLSNKRRRYYLFGDKAYIHRRDIMSPYVGYVTGRNNRFNKGMSTARDTVELGYGKTQNLCMSNALKQQSKKGLQPVGGLF